MQEETRDRNHRNICRHRHGHRAALGFGALLVAAALLAPAGARADHDRASRRQGTHDRAHRVAVVHPGPRGPVAFRGTPAYVRSDARDRAARWRPSERHELRRRPERPLYAGRRHRFAFQHERHERHERIERYERHERMERARSYRRARRALLGSRAPAAWVQVTWGWPFPH